MPPAPSSSSRARAIAGVQAVLDRYFANARHLGYTGHDSQLMADLVIVDASIGPPYGTSTSLPDHPEPPAIVSSVTWALDISASMCNLNGVMHGGAAGVIFDMCTTMALGPVARPGFWDFMGGVTRTLNISYLKAVPKGTKVHIHGYVYQVGRTMAYIKGWMTSPDGKTVYALCEHHKVNVPTQPEHNKLRIPWDDLWDEKGRPKEKL